MQKDWSKQAGFSWMQNFMIHAVDLVKWYLPNITEVMGYGFTSNNTKQYNIDVWDSMRFLMRNEQAMTISATNGGKIVQISEVLEQYHIKL